MSSQSVVLTLDNFDAEVLDSPTPVVVGFWADWCEPSTALTALIEDIADDYPDIQAASVDIGQNVHLANDHRIDALPTVIVFHQGHVWRRCTERTTRDEVTELFDSVVDMPTAEAA